MVSEIDENGIYVGEITQIPDVIADGATFAEMKAELARQLVEYAYDYREDYQRYSTAPNRHDHAGQVMRVSIDEGNLDAVMEMIEEDA